MFICNILVYLHHKQKQIIMRLLEIIAIFFGVAVLIYGLRYINYTPELSVLLFLIGGGTIYLIIGSHIDKK